MAYTKTPSFSTYSTETLPIFSMLASRGDSTDNKDTAIFNGLVELVSSKDSQEKRAFLLKRAGSLQKQADQGGATRGAYCWADEQKLFYAVGNNIVVYHIATDTITTLTGVFATTTGDVGFCTFLYETGVSVVCASDGTKLVTISASNVVTASTSPDLPVPHLPSIVFLDGYLCLVEADTANIVNSNLDAPLLFTAGDFINAEMEGDKLIYLGKINNYVIAFGTNTIEYFWNAANSSGSPLQRNDTPVKNTSFLGGYSTTGNDVFFIGSSGGGQPEVFKMADFKLEAISTPSTSRHLAQDTSGFSTWKGSIVSIQGKTFYLMSVGTIKTFVYDLDTKIWYSWGFQGLSYFPMSFCVTGKTDSTIPIFFFLEGSSTLYAFSETTYTDNSTLFTARIVLAKENFGSMFRKFMGRLSFIGDRPDVSAPIAVSWSDDDYKTFTAPKEVELNQDLPSLRQLGSFRRRAFKLEFTQNSPLRLEGLEVDINKGRK